MGDTSDYEKIREDAKHFYDQTSRAYCPALSAQVSFGAEGFNHIIYKGNGIKRDLGIQILRFKLLPQTIQLVKLTTTHQEYEEVLQEVNVAWLKKHRKETRVVKFWGLIAILGNRKIKVIVRQVGDSGQKHFWSVIPAWVTSQYRDVKLISTMKGDPQED